jgi:hypothetical protein
LAIHPGHDEHARRYRAMRDLRLNRPAFFRR